MAEGVLFGAAAGALLGAVVVGMWLAVDMIAGQSTLTAERGKGIVLFCSIIVGAAGVLCD